THRGRESLLYTSEQLPRANLARMLMQRSLASPQRHLSQVFTLTGQGLLHVICPGYHLQIVLHIKKPVQPLPPICNKRCGASSCLKEPSGRAPSPPCHVATCD